LEKYAVNINILGRQFPAVVDREEAEVVEKASRILKEKIKAFKTEYRNQDDLNVVIMCCLDVLMEQFTLEKRQKREQEAALQEANALSETVAQLMDMVQP
jgi:cell division protein ZapA (FtsZ GTPase activity inhibitor)